jgi:hypothetical protein
MPPSEAWPQADRCLTRASALNLRLSDLHFGRAIGASWVLELGGGGAGMAAGWAAPDRDVQPERSSVTLWRGGRSTTLVGPFGSSAGAHARSSSSHVHAPRGLLSAAHESVRRRQPRCCRSVIQTHPDMVMPYFSLAEIQPRAAAV